MKHNVLGVPRLSIFRAAPIAKWQQAAGLPKNAFTSNGITALGLLPFHQKRGRAKGLYGSPYPGPSHSAPVYRYKRPRLLRNSDATSVIRFPLTSISPFSLAIVSLSRTAARLPRYAAQVRCKVRMALKALLSHDGRHRVVRKELLVVFQDQQILAMGQFGGA